MAGIVGVAIIVRWEIAHPIFTGREPAQQFGVGIDKWNRLLSTGLTLGGNQQRHSIPQGKLRATGTGGHGHNFGSNRSAQPLEDQSQRLRRGFRRQFVVRQIVGAKRHHGQVRSDRL